MHYRHPFPTFSIFSLSQLTFICSLSLFPSLYTFSPLSVFLYRPLHLPLSRYYTCTYQDKIQLYMVLDGHDGTRACDFVQKHLPYSVLRSDLERDNISTALTMAFKNTEREFFIGIDPHITRRLTLVIEIQVLYTCTCLCVCV